jgi:hypothetical protein
MVSWREAHDGGGVNCGSPHLWPHEGGEGPDQVDRIDQVEAEWVGFGSV